MVHSMNVSLIDRKSCNWFPYRILYWFLETKWILSATLPEDFKEINDHSWINSHWTIGISVLFFVLFKVGNSNATTHYDYVCYQCEWNTLNSVNCCTTPLHRPHHHFAHCSSMIFFTFNFLLFSSQIVWKANKIIISTTWLLITPTSKTIVPWHASSISTVHRTSMHQFMCLFKSFVCV